ncbi:hypothetical protein Ddye_002289 [Dipteronia dyeriana]|uniref:Uncharacterized protein n=1 Tax=Dipteronia dyeriana TaxID=168575 RepID=A0AAE0CU74_9ROSI|nr:hypothetical protein Ddye_002289 [Dipteronia dyeriana]
MQAGHAVQEQCNVNGKFEQKTIEFIASTYQIPLPPVDEWKKIVEDVDKDKRYATDAAIEESQSFAINPIKKRKEDSISRDYLERVKENPNTFRYLA